MRYDVVGADDERRIQVCDVGVRGIVGFCRLRRVKMPIGNGETVAELAEAVFTPTPIEQARANVQLIDIPVIMNFFTRIISLLIDAIIYG